MVEDVFFVADADAEAGQLLVEGRVVLWWLGFAGCNAPFHELSILRAVVDFHDAHNFGVESQLGTGGRDCVTKSSQIPSNLPRLWKDITILIPLFFILLINVLAPQTEVDSVSGLVCAHVRVYHAVVVGFELRPETTYLMSLFEDSDFEGVWLLEELVGCNEAARPGACVLLEVTKDEADGKDDVEVNR